MRSTPVGRRLVAGGVGTAVVACALVATTGTATAAPTTPAQVGAAERAVQAATAAIAQHPAALAASADDTFTVSSTATDPNGATHTHFDRAYKGLKVLGGDVVVHNAPGGAFSAASLTQTSPLALSTTPKVAQADAQRTAAGRFAGTRSGTRSELVVDEFTSATPTLAWQVVVDGIAPDQSPSHLNVLVDAATGAVRQSWDTFEKADTGTGKGYQVGTVSVGTTQSGTTYSLKDAGRGGGETKDAQNRTSNSGVSFTSTTNTFGDGTLSNRATVGVDAHYGIMKTWDYYKNTHGRNGIENNGVGAVSYVHYGTNYANAGWDDSCFCMIYGDGSPGSKPFTALDVAGHEMSHGVTSATANLTYSGESGGLNESTSDIFGTLVEFTANSPADAPDYLIGEKIDINGNGSPLRYMDDPTKDGASKGCWYSGVGNVDVHYSSGVGNHFFYLLAVGSGSSQWGNSPTCSGAPAVTGIGNDKAGKIWYRALTTYMTSNTNYAAARTASINAAKDLYGAGTECAAVNAAWKAVAVTGTDPGCTAGGGQAPVVTNPGSQTGTVGTAVSLQLSASDPQGDAVTFTATGLPAGLSISTSGRISGTPTTAGTSTVVVTAKDPAGNAGTATFTFTVNPVGGGTCTPAQLVSNGGFESGTTPWTASTGVLSAATTAEPAHGGTRIAWLNGYGTTHTDTLSTTITVPTGCRATLTYWLHIDTKESGTTAYDKLTLAAGTTTLASYSNANSASGYQQRTVDLSSLAGKGATVLKWTGTEDSSLATNFVIDDVAVATS
ncbi:M4 family metallopeptidase [Actinokineospora bangkokensis]|uniref:Dystroglycan-type cadherin-like domain-containing protein n=1 Tax=Actinokineospora bangkokensis TaxID=1193682 RepID=A0A1Q9LDH4_9PSEU|nr:M4 family metallopeptidase [Actinokineospora bangkokensis]OLR90055.1 hypothetical protein BJP25_03500 [Actinokineospora bangkokensis]